MFRVGLIVLLSGLLSSLALAQEAEEQPAEEKQPSVAELAVQIRDAVEQLQAVREERQRMEQLHRDAVERVQRQIQSLRADLAVVEPVVEKQQKQLQELQQQIAQRQEQQTFAKKLIELTVQQTQPAAEQVFQRTERQSGGRLSQRLLRFKDAATTLKQADETTQRQVEALAVFCNALGEEWPRAKAVSLGNEVITLGKQEHHAWVVEFGLATKLFVTEDRRLVGLSSPNPQQSWITDASEEAQQHARQVLRVIQEESPPALTPLPIQVGPPK